MGCRIAALASRRRHAPPLEPAGASTRFVRDSLSICRSETPQGRARPAQEGYTPIQSLPDFNLWRWCGSERRFRGRLWYEKVCAPGLACQLALTGTVTVPRRRLRASELQFAAP